MQGERVILTAAGTGLTLLCLFAISWLGPAGAFFNLLTPLPAAYLSLRLGLRCGVAIVGITALLVLSATSLYTALSYLTLFGTGSLLLPFALLLRTSWDRSVAFAAAGSVALAALLLGLIALAGPHAPTALVDQLVQSEAEQAMQLYRSVGFSEQQLAEIGTLVEQLAAFVRSSFFGLFSAIVLAIQALTLLLLQQLTKKKFPFAGVAFARWRLPARLIWLLIFAGFSAFMPVPLFAWIGRNLLLVLLPLYFVQGMAVVSSFLQRRPYPPVIKGLIYTLLLVLNPLPMIVTSIGIFDLWIDFRKTRQEKLS